MTKRESLFNSGCELTWKGWGRTSRDSGDPKRGVIKKSLVELPLGDAWNW